MPLSKMGVPGRVVAEDVCNEGFLILNNDPYYFMLLELRAMNYSLSPAPLFSDLRILAMRALSATRSTN